MLACLARIQLYLFTLRAGLLSHLFQNPGFCLHQFPAETQVGYAHQFGIKPQLNQKVNHINLTLTLWYLCILISSRIQFL